MPRFRQHTGRIPWSRGQTALDFELRAEADMRSALWMAVRHPRLWPDVREGHWLIRLGRRGPVTPAAILRIHTQVEPGDPNNVMERSPFLAAFIAGEPAKLEEVWRRRLEEISAEEYAFRVADLRWCQEHAPEVPEADPRRPVDLRNLPSVF